MDARVARNRVFYENTRRLAFYVGKKTGLLSIGA